MTYGDGACRGAVVLTVPEASLSARLDMFLDCGFRIENVAKMVELHPLVSARRSHIACCSCLQLHCTCNSVRMGPLVLSGAQLPFSADATVTAVMWLPGCQIASSCLPTRWCMRGGFVHAGELCDLQGTAGIAPAHQIGMC